MLSFFRGGVQAAIAGAFDRPAGARGKASSIAGSDRSTPAKQAGSAGTDSDGRFAAETAASADSSEHNMLVANVDLSDAPEAARVSVDVPVAPAPAPAGGEAGAAGADHVNSPHPACAIYLVPFRLVVPTCSSARRDAQPPSGLAPRTSRRRLRQESRPLTTSRPRPLPAVFSSTYAAARRTRTTRSRTTLPCAACATRSTTRAAQRRNTRRLGQRLAQLRVPS
jgi:hypothetical protein